MSNKKVKTGIAELDSVLGEGVPRTEIGKFYGRPLPVELIRFWLQMQALERANEEWFAGARKERSDE